MSSDHDFSTLFERLPIGAYRTDAHGKQLRANQAMATLFGFENETQMLSAEKSSGGGWYVQPGRREEFRSQLLAMGSLRNFVSEMRRNNGEIFWVSENAHSVLDSAGQLLYHEGTVEDITLRIQAEQAAKTAGELLQERTEALQITLDNAGRGIIRLDIRGRVVFYNQHLLELLDLPKAMLDAKPLASELIQFQKQRGDFENAQMEADDLLPLSRRSELDSQHKFSPGTYLRRNRKNQVLEIATVILADGSIVRTYSDVTAYFNAQQNLADTSRTLKLALNHMSQGWATIDAHGRITNSNQRYREMLDFSEDLLASHPSIDELVKLQIARGDFTADAQFVAEDANRRFARGERIPTYGPDMWVNAARIATGLAEAAVPPSGPLTYLRETRGTTLEVMIQPLAEGGDVRTYTDVTGYVKTQRELEQKQAQLRLVQHSFCKFPAPV
jgi:PAS domain S-box-containing protein